MGGVLLCEKNWKAFLLPGVFIGIFTYTVLVIYVTEESYLAKNPVGIYQFAIHG